MRVHEIMTERIERCRPDDTLEQAASIMAENDCGSVPVVGADERVVGVLTDRDGLMAAFRQGRGLSDLKVRDAMSDRLYSCGPDDATDQAERLMREHQIRRLAVVDGEQRLCGMLSLADLARSQDSSPDEIGRTLGQIVEPSPTPAS